MSRTATAAQLCRSGCRRVGACSDYFGSRVELLRIMRVQFFVKGESYGLQARKRAGVPYPPPVKAVGKAK